MFELLEKLREKPVAVRKRIAFFTALGVAAVIFTVWVTIIYPQANETRAIQAKAAAAAPSPWSAFADTLSNGFSAMGEKIGTLKSTVSNVVPTPEHYTATSTQ